MAENLKVTRTADGKPVQSYFYVDDSVKYEKYGRLYEWEAAMNGNNEEKSQGIAPERWHMPSDADWRQLFDYLKENSFSGKESLKGGKTGFDALLEGGADFRGHYLYRGQYSMFWSSTEANERRAYHYGPSADGQPDKFAAMKGARIAIRCIKDQQLLVT